MRTKNLPNTSGHTHNPFDPTARDAGSATTIFSESGGRSFADVLWTTVGMLAPLGIAAAVAARFAGGPRHNYTEAQGPVYGGRFAPRARETSDPSPSDDPSITAATFNLRRGARVTEAIAEFRSHPRLRGADLVLLQEMSEQGTARIARELGYNFVYYPACVHPRLNRNIGNAVLSRGEIRDNGKVLLPHLSPHNEQLRIAAHATTTVGGVPLTAYSIHLETQLLPYDRRLEQVAAVLETAPEDGPLIVAGDFNTPPGEELSWMEGLFEEFGLIRVSSGAGETWKVGPFEGTLDHVFARGLEPVRTETVEGSRSSDHKPLWVEFAPPVQEEAGSAAGSPMPATAAVS